jgi:hypothetical protein
MVQIEEWVLAVDIENTKMVYELHSYRCISDECRNFILACEKTVDKRVLQFADQLGIDLTKPSQLESHQVNNNTAIMYSGKYHVVGQIIEGEMNAWDLVLNEHCFSLSDEFEMIPIVMEGPVIEISFEVVLPWVLEL